MTKSIYQSLSLVFTIFLSFSLSSAHNNTTTIDASADASANLHVNFKGCFSKVYAFGDSDMDKGNAGFLGGLSGRGSAFLGGSASFGGSSSLEASTKGSHEGHLIIDYLCDSLALPALSLYKNFSGSVNGGVNFAIAGSTALSSDFFAKPDISSLLWHGVPLSFDTEIDWFNKFMLEVGCDGRGKGSCKADIDNSLFWLGEVGISDYITAIGSSLSLRILTEISSKKTCNLLQTLLVSGAKYVVVQGLPPVGCLPIFMALSPEHDRDHMGCVATVNKGIMLHNQILQMKLERFRKKYPGTSILYADYWNAYLTVAMNPKKYQMEETVKTCCGCGGGKFNFNKDSMCGSEGSSVCKDPQKFIHWDGIHLTDTMYKHVTDLFLNQGFCQPSFNEVIKSKKNM